MLKRKMVLIAIAMVISTVWLFAAYAAAQGMPESPITQVQKLKKEAAKIKEDQAARKAKLESAIKDITKMDTEKFSKSLVEKNVTFIPVFIDPETGVIFVPGDEEFTPCNGSKADDLNKFINAENTGKNSAIGQFFHYQKNPYCFWYVDQYGQLRQKCI